MLLTQKTEVELVRAIMTDSSPTQLVTEEGLPVSVPSSLLRLFSPFLRELLSLPPCLSTSIIIPGTDLNTLSLLLDLLKEGKSTKNFTSTESIQDLASSLGIELVGLNVSSGARPVTIISSRGQKGVKLKPTNNPKKVIKPNKINITKVRNKNSDLLRNIKEEKSEETSSSNGSGSTEKTSSKFKCQICEKIFHSVNPLAFHYCKHFYKDLLSLNFPDFVEDNKCIKCNRTFADRQAILCHVGVKHKYINHVLTANGLDKLQLGRDLPAGTPTTPSGLSIKRELPGVGLNDSEVRSSQKPRKLPRVNSASKGRNSKEVKEIKVCEICDKEQDNMSKLVNHMIGSHLLTEIKQKYAHLYNGKECLECNKPLPKASVWQHIGGVHNKLDEVLIERGLRPIKVPPTPSLRQVVVKTEQVEEEPRTGEEQELQISNLFASYEAEVEENTEVEMASDPLI